MNSHMLIIKYKGRKKERQGTVSNVVALVKLNRTSQVNDTKIGTLNELRPWQDETLVDPWMIELPEGTVLYG